MTDRCLTVRELARRWRVREAKVKEMIRKGLLQAIDLGRKFGASVRITPEAIREAERGLAVKPKVKKRRQERIPPHIEAMMERSDI